MTLSNREAKLILKAIEKQFQRQVRDIHQAYFESSIGLLNNTSDKKAAVRRDNGLVLAVSVYRSAYRDLLTMTETEAAK